MPLRYVSCQRLRPKVGNTDGARASASGFSPVHLPASFPRRHGRRRPTSAKVHFRSSRRSSRLVIFLTAESSGLCAGGVSSCGWMASRASPARASQPVAEVSTASCR